MLVNNNVNSPSFNALMIKKTPKNIELLHELRREHPDWFLEIQKAGEILGAPGSENSTKYYELMIDKFDLVTFSMLRPYIKVNFDKNAYWGSFKNGAYYGYAYPYHGNEKLTIFPTSREDKNIGELLLKRKRIEASRGLALNIHNVSLIAKLLKIMDSYSEIINTGSKELLKKVIIPEKMELMSVSELIEKYGIAAW